MKKLIFLLLSFVSFAAIGQEVGSGQTGVKGNPNIIAIDSIIKTYEHYIREVNDMSSGLSDLEKERAASFLTGTYSLVMESYVDKGNPADPGLTEWMTKYRKFAGDNPYTIYTQAPVNVQYEYKLSGKIGNSIYFGLQMYSLKEGFNLPSANIGLNDIKFNTDGTFEIYISKNRPADVQNWVPLAEGDHCFLIRQYFRNRSDIQPAQLKIERTDQNIANNHVPQTTLLERLENARKMLVDYIAGTIEINDILRQNAFNAYPKPGSKILQPKYGGSMYPTKDNVYQGFWVSLKPGQAIHLHGKPPKALYASYVFYDRWYQTPDYRKINSFRTLDELVLNPDGTYDIYISPEKIDHPNWINTGGLYEGSYSSRYMLSQDREFPTVEVINITDISK
jgi:hypothetical protein